jgi:hypothetical protein
VKSQINENQNEYEKARPKREPVEVLWVKKHVYRS